MSDEPKPLSEILEALAKDEYGLHGRWNPQKLAHNAARAALEAARAKVNDAPGVYNVEQHNQRRMLVEEIDALLKELGDGEH